MDNFNGYYGDSFHINQSYEYQQYMAKQNERRMLKKNAMILGVLLLMYELLIFLMGYVFYFAFVSIKTGGAVLSWTEVRTYFDQHQELVYSTAFGMAYSSFVVIVSFALVMIIARFGFKVNIGHIYRFEKGQGKTACKCFPAVMTVNLAISLIIGYISMYLSGLGVVVPEADFSYSDTSAMAFVFQILYGVIIAPIVEESIYRGLAIHLLKPYGKRMAVVISAVIFGLMHGNIAQAVNGICFGLVMGTITVQCGSIIPTVMIHIMNNALAEIPDIADVLGSDIGYELYLAAVIVCLVLGTLVMFANHRRIRLPKDEGCVMNSTERYNTALLNPPMLLYWCYIAYVFISSFIEANF